MGAKGFLNQLFAYCSVIVDVWELRKLNLYGKDACPGPQSDSSGWNRGHDGKFSNGRNGKRGELHEPFQ